MKLIYIELVVLLYALQIFIGSSHSLPNASSCSPQTCKGDNQQCLKSIDNRLFCICSPKYYYNETTEKCEQTEYEWVYYTDELENDMKLVYVNDDYIISRWIHNNDDNVVTDDLIINLKILSYNFRNRPSRFKRIEVLLIQPDHYGWQPSSNGAIPNNSIEGGQHQNKTVHVCRFKHYDRYYGGMVNRDDRICYSVNWAIRNSIYDILVYKP